MLITQATVWNSSAISMEDLSLLALSYRLSLISESLSRHPSPTPPITCPSWLASGGSSHQGHANLVQYLPDQEYLGGSVQMQSCRSFHHSVLYHNFLTGLVTCIEIEPIYVWSWTGCLQNWHTGCPHVESQFNWKVDLHGTGHLRLTVPAKLTYRIPASWLTGYQQAAIQRTVLPVHNSDFDIILLG